jgi:hypothetical protein
MSVSAYSGVWPGTTPPDGVDSLAGSVVDGELDVGWLEAPPPVDSGRTTGAAVVGLASLPPGSAASLLFIVEDPDMTDESFEGAVVVVVVCAEAAPAIIVKAAAARIIFMVRLLIRSSRQIPRLVRLPGQSPYSRNVPLRLAAAT